MKTGIRMLLAALVLALPLTSNAAVFVSVNFAPPPLLVYEQPPCPGPDFIWIPGFWAWDPEVEDYYWVPGTWELAPRPAYYWTPGFWAFVDTAYVWHPGYWGPQVGWYGGIDYGYGYTGHGYHGGRWENDHFYYNTAVNHVDVTRIHNTYNTTVVNNIHVTRVSYNGGDGGVRERPRPEEEAASREHHFDPTPDHQRHVQEARRNRAQFASRRDGGGDQVIAATPKPAALSTNNVVRAQRPQWNPPAEARRDRNDRDNDRIDRADRNDRDDRKDRNDRQERAQELRSQRADLDKPLPTERPQSRRHREDNPVKKPDALRLPESAPREASPREREPAEKNPHYERMRPIPRDDEPAKEPRERPQRMERMERQQRMERRERPERHSGADRAPPEAREARSAAREAARAERAQRNQQAEQHRNQQAEQHRQQAESRAQRADRHAQAPQQLRRERAQERGGNGHLR